MQKRERLIKQIVVESAALLELIQWKQSTEDLDAMRAQVDKIQTQLDLFKKALG